MYVDITMVSPGYFFVISNGEITQKDYSVEKQTGRLRSKLKV